MGEIHLHDRYPKSIAAVVAFFAQFYGENVVVSDDPDPDRDRILVRLGPAERVVAISADFLENADSMDIRERLAAWNVAHLSRTLERGCVLFVTSEGPEEEREPAF